MNYMYTVLNNPVGGFVETTVHWPILKPIKPKGTELFYFLERLHLGYMHTFNAGLSKD